LHLQLPAPSGTGRGMPCTGSAGLQSLCNRAGHVLPADSAGSAVRTAAAMVI